MSLEKLPMNPHFTLQSMLPHTELGMLALLVLVGMALGLVAYVSNGICVALCKLFKTKSKK